ncbi:serine hydrolase domain-containing protein [Actinomadura rudentiformis]|uniref:Beta-lactamase family protein n=1 Tax=Actinomadura rudentiformis TaxID=359158 RepID=A0A6H9YJY9_9ACTN|nr:serine hydrolase domain-containing protein [Actinomadura rudentiformis]KAB2345898.1 beta-lactamase family protein [Actinomadura rudentiformis]
MVKRLAFCAVGISAAALFAPTFVSPASGAPTYSRAQLQRDVDAIRDTGTTGVLAQVVHNGRSLKARSGVADLRTRQPVPWDSYYRVGSNTKTFVATVMLQLVGEGKVKLTDTVERWLPGLVKGNGNDGSKITVRHLLRQTSGLYDYSYYLPQDVSHTPETYRKVRFRSYPPQQLVRMAMRHAPLFPPDERRWNYSNTNYVLAGMIIAKATGNPWEHEVHERIIAPLGLRHTYSPGTSAYVPQPRPVFYERFKPGGPLVDVSIFSDGHADGALISTTDDMNRFLRALLGGKLLSPALMAQMKDTVEAKEWQILYKEAGYGLGLAKRRTACGTWAWYHGGSMFGVASVNSVSTDGRTSVEIMLPTQPGEEKAKLAQLTAANDLTDHALCGNR